MKRYLLFSLLLALTGFFGSQANAQCVYTTIADGKAFNDPTNYTVSGPGSCSALPFGPASAVTGNTSATANGNVFVIQNKISLTNNFYLGKNGSITIKTGSSLIASAPNLTLSLSDANLTIEPSASRTPLMPQLSVGVLDLLKTSVSVGMNSVVVVGCTLVFGTQSNNNFTLGNNSLLIVSGNVDVSAGNPSITGAPAPGLAGLRIVGNIVGNQGGGGNLFTTSGLITCVKGQPQPSGCVATAGSIVTPPTTNDPACQNAALPVTLTRFNGKRTTKGTVILNWSTANELSNSYFAVERSADALNFVPLARIAGSGTSSSAQTYSFTDENPLAGHAYYRLRQIDVDGTDSYSPVVSVATQSIQESLVYPNPSAGTVTLPATMGTVHYRIFNALGQVVLRGEAVGNDKLDLTSLPKGTFFLELAGVSGWTTQRLVRQ